MTLFLLYIYVPTSYYSHCHMPIGYDNYGLRSHTRKTPEKYRYKWRCWPFTVNEESLSLYSSHAGRDSPLAPIHEVLNIHETLTPLEEVRVDLFEVLIGQIRRSDVSVDVINMSAAHNLKPLHELKICVDIVTLAGRVIFLDPVCRCMYFWSFGHYVLNVIISLSISRVCVTTRLSE